MEVAREHRFPILSSLVKSCQVGNSQTWGQLRDLGLPN